MLVQMVVSPSFRSTSSVSTKIRAVNSRFTHGVAVFVSGMCADDARGASSTVLRTHLPAVCPHCAMGHNVLQNIRRAVLTEAVRSVAMVV